MAVNLSPIGGVAGQFFDNNGFILVGGKIYTYAAGTTTPQATYTSALGITPHANPIILDSAGRVPGGEIWLTDGLVYKFVIETSTGILIGTYDNIIGINSNFVNYTIQEEVITATAGQTVFNLSTINYTPGTNSLSVFIDGVNQYVGDSYLETDSDTVTFTSGVHVGGEVKFTTAAPVNTGAIDANNVGYTANFTGAVGQTVQTKLEQYVSVKDFGAVGDGVADDTAAVQAAIDSEQPLDWGGLTYKITSTVSHTYAKNVFWQGRNATIIYAGAHVERAVLLQGGGIDYVINDITFDGSKLCNKCLDIANDTDSYSNLTFNNVFVTRAKRINTFNGGAGLSVRGSYNVFNMIGGGANNCELPSGQGTSGVIGITGVTVTQYSTTRYVKAMNVSGVKIEKVYSSDLSYQSDQDGIIYFTPDGTAGAKYPGVLTVTSSEFINCYGRSVKTQCRDTNIYSCTFTRTEGLTSGVGNNEIDAQDGNGNFRDLVFSYSSAQEPGVCVNASSNAGGGAKPGLLVDGCSVYCDTATTLSTFAQSFPSNGLFSRHSVTNNKIFGKVERFFDFLCNGDKNYAEVSNNYVQEIVNGPTSEKALIYVRSSGATTPFFGDVMAYGNVYDNTHLPALVRDSVPLTSMQSSLSAWNNYGFETNNVARSPGAVGLKNNAVARLSKIGASDGAGYFQIENASISSGATQTFKIRNDSRATLVFINAVFNATAYAFFVNNNLTNTVVNKGAAFEIGNTTNPGTGTFRVWSSATDEISIENTNASARTFAIFAMVVG